MTSDGVDASGVTPERSILLRDFLAGLAAVVGPAWFLTDGIGLWAVPAVVVGAVLAGVAEYCSERRHVPSWLTDPGERPATLIGLGIGCLLVAVAPLFVPALVRLYLAALFGSGIGLLVHRIVYGVVWPIPEAYVARVRGSEE